MSYVPLDSEDLYPHVDHDVDIFTEEGRVYLYCETCGETITSTAY